MSGRKRRAAGPCPRRAAGAPPRKNMSTRISESFPLPSRERPFDKRSGGPIAEQWEGEGARAEIATVAPRPVPDGAHAVLLGPSPLAVEVREGVARSAPR